MKYTHFITGGVCIGTALVCNYFGLPLIASGTISALLTTAAHVGQNMMKNHAAKKAQQEIINQVNLFFDTDNEILNTIKANLSCSQVQDMREGIQSAVVETIDKIDRGESIPVSKNPIVQALTPYLLPYIDVKLSTEMKEKIANHVLDRALAPFLVSLSSKITLESTTLALSSVASNTSKAYLTQYLTGTVGQAHAETISSMATLENGQKAIAALSNGYNLLFGNK